MRRSSPKQRNRFYAVVDGVIWSGNAKSVTDGDAREGDARTEVPPDLAPLFSRFQELLDNAPSVEALDEESRRALEALGYAP